MMEPRTRIALALRAALRRRYAYAALNALRRGVRLALREHLRRSLDARQPYDGSAELKAIAAAQRRALARLRKRWPSLLPEWWPRRRRRRRARSAPTAKLYCAAVGGPPVYDGSVKQ
jgi:hypothetical protein